MDEMTAERLSQLREATAASWLDERTGKTVTRVRAVDIFNLIREVERLQFEVEIAERANLANGQMVARMAGYVPVADQRELLANERLP